MMRLTLSELRNGVRKDGTGSGTAAGQTTANFFSADGLALLERAATLIAGSGLAPEAYRAEVRDSATGRLMKNPAAQANCMMALCAAARLNLDPLTVMQNLRTVNGRAAWTGEFILTALGSCGRFTPLEFLITEAGNDDAEPQRKNALLRPDEENDRENDRKREKENSGKNSGESCGRNVGGDAGGKQAAEASGPREERGPGREDAKAESAARTSDRQKPAKTADSGDRQKTERSADGDRSAAGAEGGRAAMPAANARETPAAWEGPDESFAMNAEEADVTGPADDAGNNGDAKNEDAAGSASGRTEHAKSAKAENGLPERPAETWGTRRKFCVARAREKSTGRELASGPVGLNTKERDESCPPELLLRFRAAAQFCRLYAPELLMGLPYEEDARNATSRREHEDRRAAPAAVKETRRARTEITLKAIAAQAKRSRAAATPRAEKGNDAPAATPER